MAVSESILLKRFAENRDADAFSEIVKRYADPVYNTCRRILYDEAGAADAAQETFYQLMCNAGSIKGSLAGWLHSVATRKAIDSIRRSSRRRSRERWYAFSNPKEVNQWKDISPYIDEEMGKLSPQYRDVLIRYFFEGKTMNEIAEIKQVSQPTVSRTITAAVGELRKRLSKKGMIVTLFVLQGLISRNVIVAAPPVLITELGKMSLVGATTGVLTSFAAVSTSASLTATGSTSVSALSAGSAKTAISAVFSTMRAKVITAIAISSIGTGAVVTYNAFKTKPQPEHSSAIVQQETIGEYDPIMDVSAQPMPLGKPMTGAAYGGGGLGGGRATSGTEIDDIPINLSDPENTIETFTEILVADKLELWKNCFTADSQALTDLNRIFSDPQNAEEKQLQTALSSIGSPLEIVELLEIENGLSMKLFYTVYDPFTIDHDNAKLTFQEDDQFEINAELILVDSEWKIVNIYTAYPLPDLITNSIQ